MSRQYQEQSSGKREILIYRFEEYGNMMNNIKKEIDKKTHELHKEKIKLEELSKSISAQEEKCAGLQKAIEDLRSNHAEFARNLSKSLYGEKITNILYGNSDEKLSLSEEEFFDRLEQNLQADSKLKDNKEYMNGSRAQKNQSNFSNDNIRGGNGGEEINVAENANKYVKQRREESEQLGAIQEEIKLAHGENLVHILKTRKNMQDSYQRKNILNRLREESNIYDHKQKIQDKKNEFDETQQTQYYPGPIGEGEGFVDQKSYQLILSDSIIQGGGERRQNPYETEHKSFQKKIHDQLQSMSGFSDF